MFRIISFWQATLVLGARKSRGLRAHFYQCAGRGRAQMCCAALARIRTANKAVSCLYQPCAAQDQPVIAQASVYDVVRAHQPRALAERLPRENDRRAVKQIAMARCALIMLAATLGPKTIASHCRAERRTRRYHLASPRRARLHRLIVARCAPVLCQMLTACAREYLQRVAILGCSLEKYVFTAGGQQDVCNPTVRLRGASHCLEGLAARM